MDKKLLLVSGLCVLFFLSTVTFWLAYSNADEERDEFKAEVSSLQDELENRKNALQQTKISLNSSRNSLKEVNSSYRDYRNKAFVLAYADSFYETEEYDNVITVSVSNLGKSQVSDVTGICGLYEDSSDKEASDAFYIDLEAVAGSQTETRTYAFQNDKYDLEFSGETSIACYVSSAENGIPGSENVETWNNLVEEWESLASTAASPDEI